MDQLSMVMKDKEREEGERKARELEETIAAVRVQYDEEFERRKESWIDDFKWFLRHDLIKPDVVKLATSANGAVVLTNLLKRGFPADFVPPELVETVPSFRSEEHTYELQSLMRTSYAVFCLNKKTHITHIKINTD